MTIKEKDGWTIDDWIKKLKQQAEDSSEYRHNLYEKVALESKKKILDVGCGTGAVTLDIALLTTGEVVGVDIDKEKLQEAERVLSQIPNITLMESDVLDLPFDDGTFDLVVFNIVLMYIKDQQRAVNEMARVTEKGGHVLATLEPDYATRIDYPEAPFMPMVLRNLEELGADLETGRKLKYLFNIAGLKTTIGMETESNYIIMDDETALNCFLSDFWNLQKLLDREGWSQQQIDRYKEEEIERLKNGQSFHFTPCFYAIGMKVEHANLG